MKSFDWPDDHNADCTVPSLTGGDELGLAENALMALSNAGRARDFDLMAAEQLADSCPRATGLLRSIADDMAKHKIGDEPLRYHLDDCTEDELALVNQVLGEGEVSMIVAGSAHAQIQESVMAGLWRVYITDKDGELVTDYIEIGDVPEVAKLAAENDMKTDFDISEPPEGAMNVKPVLAEIRDRMGHCAAGKPNHVISFTLLPMTPEDMNHLQQTLGMGSLQIISRGYGTCRIVSTGIQNVWSVQYFNAMDTVILDTLEIGGMPWSVTAGQEDLEDSADRLREIMEAYL